MRQVELKPPRRGKLVKAVLDDSVPNSVFRLIVAVIILLVLSFGTLMW